MPSPSKSSETIPLTTDTWANKGNAFIEKCPLPSLIKTEELNQLAHEKQKNESIAKSAFDQRVKETKQKAIEDNKKNAEKHGNVVTQDIDADGNLVGAGYNTTEQSFSAKEPESISVADIRSELFDGDNVVVGKTDYGQSQLKSGPFASKKDE